MEFIDHFIVLIELIIKDSNENHLTYLCNYKLFASPTPQESKHLKSPITFKVNLIRGVIFKGQYFI